MAKAGSCKIGLKPSPFSGTGIIRSNGFDVKIVKRMNPIIIKACVSRVFVMKLKLELL